MMTNKLFRIERKTNVYELRKILLYPFRPVVYVHFSLNDSEVEIEYILRYIARLRQKGFRVREIISLI